MIKGLVAGGVNVMLALSAGAPAASLDAIALGGLVGFLGIGVSLVLFMLALRHLGTARTGAYFSLAPFIGALLGIVLFKEAVTVQLATAAGLMMLGLWLHLEERHEHEHAHEMLSHDHAHIHDDHHDHIHEGPVTEPHSHRHEHRPMRHKHIHYPDLHHRHEHSRGDHGS